MDRLLRLGGGMTGLNSGPPPSDAPVVDTAEQVQQIYSNGNKINKCMINEWNCF